jgi:hypothetical protein
VSDRTAIIPAESEEQALLPRGVPKEHEIEAALLALLQLTEGGLENARKVVSRVTSDTEAARLIAAASWGTVGGAAVGASGARVEGRNQRICVQIRGRKMTLTPKEWMRRVRQMFSEEATAGTQKEPNADYSESEESISLSAGTK